MPLDLRRACLICAACSAIGGSLLEAAHPEGAHRFFDRLQYAAPTHPPHEPHAPEGSFDTTRSPAQAVTFASTSSVPTGGFDSSAFDSSAFDVFEGLIQLQRGKA